MAKIKELLANREALAKYDELTEWKGAFECDGTMVAYCRKNKYMRNYIPDRIKKIIVSALDAEIEKLEKE